MLDGDNGTLRAVAWSEIFPWLSIFRTFRLAISLRVLLLAAVALLLTATGWAVFGWMFSGDPARRAGSLNGPSRTSIALGRRLPASYPTDRVCPAWGNRQKSAGTAPPGLIPPGQDPLFGSWAQLSRPLWAAFDLRVNVSGLACLVLCGLWSLAISGVFRQGDHGGIAAVELACEERVGWGAALAMPAAKWLSYCWAPLLP